MSTTFILLLLLLLLSGAGAQTPEPSPIKYGVSFRPSVGIVIGIFAIMFSLTILLLMYAKFCHVAATGLFLREPNPGAAGLNHHLLHPTQPRFSGVDKTLIESLPFFRFSSLRGSRAGLECAVCLSPFTDAEILRLLPKCKHAFHIDCVDRWLSGHSSCPLCRHRVDPSDAEIFNQFSLSSRFSLLNSSSRRVDDHHQQEQEQEQEHEHEEEEAVVEFFVERDQEENKPQFYHKFKHRIIVSDVMFKSRWSDVNSSDLMALNSEMLCLVSSKRFDGVTVSVKDELEKKRMMEKKIKKMNDFVLGSGDVGGCSSTDSLIPPGNRCMSEITKVARFAGERSGVKEAEEEHEKRRRVWLPIARRTVKWFAGGPEERVELREIITREEGIIEV